MNFINGQNNLSNAVNEEFNKLNNDPLIMMRAEEQKALQRSSGHAPESPLQLEPVLLAVVVAGASVASVSAAP